VWNSGIHTLKIEAIYSSEISVDMHRVISQKIELFLIDIYFQCPWMISTRLYSSDHPD
jgi:hypothetical protein